MYLEIKNLDSKTILLSEKKTILQSIGENHIDWMQACGAKGRCTTCKMVVLEGGAYLSELTEIEKKMIELKKIRKNERLACQTHPQKEIITATKLIVVEVPKIYQLPHIYYNN